VLAALNLAYQLADVPTPGLGTTTPASNAQDLARLIHRIDAALSDDGRLL
jgi:hypothetical protein